MNHFHTCIQCHKLYPCPVEWSSCKGPNDARFLASQCDECYARQEANRDYMKDAPWPS